MTSVSVLIPTFNRCGYLLQTIESVLKQTYSDFTLHILDNASEDDTREMVAALDARKIIYHRNATNVGMAENVRRCFALCETDYWMIMADDDLLAPSHLETAIRALKQFPDAALFSTNSCRSFTSLDEPSFYASALPVNQEQEFSLITRERSLVHNFYHTPIMFPGTAGTKACADLLKETEVPSEIYALMDRYFWTTAVLTGALVVSPLPTLLYRLHPNQEIQSAWNRGNAYMEAEYLACARYAQSISAQSGISLKAAIAEESERLTPKQNLRLLEASGGSWKDPDLIALSAPLVEKARKARPKGYMAPIHRARRALNALVNS